MAKRIYAYGAGLKYLALQNAAMPICICVALNFYISQDPIIMILRIISEHIMFIS